MKQRQRPASYSLRRKPYEDEQCQEPEQLRPKANRRTMVLPMSVLCELRVTSPTKVTLSNKASAKVTLIDRSGHITMIAMER